MTKEDLDMRRMIVKQAMDSPEGRMALGQSMAGQVEEELFREFGLESPDAMVIGWKFVADRWVNFAIGDLGAAYDLLGDVFQKMKGELREEVVAILNRSAMGLFEGYVSVRAIVRDDPESFRVGWDLIMCIAALEMPLRFLDVEEELT